MLGTEPGALPYYVLQWPIAKWCLAQQDAWKGGMRKTQKIKLVI
jgi:hypothetical protein